MHPHARFRVDVAAARAVTGVVAVFTATDSRRSCAGSARFPPSSLIPRCAPAGSRSLAKDKVRYVGEPIVAVVAGSRVRRRGRRRGRARRVRAARSRAGRARARSRRAPRCSTSRSATTSRPPSPCRSAMSSAAFRSAEVVTRGRYYVHRHTGMPLETRGVAAQWDAGTGRLTLWSSTQWPHTLRDVLRDVLGLAGAPGARDRAGRRGRVRGQAGDLSRGAAARRCWRNGFACP